jgi:hypothetical protein
MKKEEEGMKHKSGDMKRRRQAAYRKGRRDLADNILDLLRAGRLDAVQERLRAETKPEGDGASDRA